MPKHKGGSLQTWTADGKPGVILYYGKGLNKQCPTCKVDPNIRCVGKGGRLFKKTHPARIT